MSRLYTEADYPILRRAAEAAGECSLTTIRMYLLGAGIAWPNRFNESRSPEAMLIDQHAIRAWRELGYHPYPPGSSDPDTTH